MVTNVVGRGQVGIRTCLHSLTSISKASDPACFLLLYPSVAVLLGSIRFSSRLLSYACLANKREQQARHTKQAQQSRIEDGPKRGGSIG
jgi:hypothetical protein